MKILIATGNEGKRREMLEVLKDLSEINFLSLQDFPKVEEPEETGSTFEENALQKAKFFANEFQIPAIGEDSGLIIEAFPDKFGLKTRREIPNKNDQEWLDVFLDMLRGQENRRATFYSASAFFDPQTNKKHVVLGTCSGVITENPQTSLEPGIPVSAVFIPEGYDCVYSAMNKKEKNEVSHRGWSMRGMVEFLDSIL
ncbi:non-canonical purine NTP pyrophosphatase [Candidatus Gracilibacteria bacterium]|nr:non-canonical purine NTP pyrophosphatase [Candidatus Gracilibacteria bacterium]